MMLMMEKMIYKGLTLWTNIPEHILGHIEKYEGIPERQLITS